MILLKSTPPEEVCKEYMFEGQNELQMGLLVVALLCIPVMLFGKPLYLMYTKPKPAKVSS